MGNCGLKPATNEGEATPAPEQKPEGIEAGTREIVVEEKETKVIICDDHEAKLGISDSSSQPPSLGQLISEVEGKATEEATPTPSEAVKESIETVTETKEVETVTETKEVIATPTKTEEAEPKKEVVEPVVAVEEKKPEEVKK